MIPKFRYFDQFNKTMNYSCEFESLKDFFEAYEAAVVGENEPILMQSTGRKDINDCEWFAGDIVKDEFGAVWEIYHEQFHWFRRRKIASGDYIYHDLTDADFSYCRWIGTIHEHPSLIKGASRE